MPVSESADAVREAAEALREPENQDTIESAQAALADPDPADAQPDNEPGVEPELEQTLDDGQAGEDYDPEDVEGGLDDIAATPETPPASESTTEIDEERRAILARYPDEGSRAEALLELERYRSGESPISQEQQAEPEPTRFVPQGPTPQSEELRTILTEMQAQDPQLDRTIADITRTGEALKADGPRLEQGYAAIVAAQKVISDLAAIHAYHTKTLERIDADDVIARDMREAELRDSNDQIRSAKIDLLEADNAYRTLVYENEKRQQTYNEGVDYVRTVGTEEWHQRVQATTNQDDHDREYNQASEEWDEAVPQVMQALGVSDSLKDVFDRNLRRMVSRATDADLEPARLLSWMKKSGKEVVEEYNRITQAAVRSHTNNRRADTVQDAPTNPIVTRTRPQDRQMSAKEADRLAAKAMRARPGA